MANVEVVDTFSDHASLDLPSNLCFIKQFQQYTKQMKWTNQQSERRCMTACACMSQKTVLTIHLLIISFSVVSFFLRQLVLQENHFTWIMSTELSTKVLDHLM